MILAFASLSLLLSAAAFCHAEEQQAAEGAMGIRPQDTPAPRIIGGTVSPSGAFPYMVSVEARIRGGDYRQVCGGAIVAPHKVVTTAGCAILWFFGDDFRIVAGDVDRETQDGTEQERSVCGVSIHPKYRFRSFDYNYAVLGLCNPFEFNAYVKAVAMTSTEPTSGVCMVSGWGEVRVGNNTLIPTTRLHNATIPLVQRPDCAKEYKQMGVDVTERIICSGEDQKGICSGDVGSPLVCADGTLVGIGMFTREPCGAAPGLYASVAFARRWIDLQE